MVINAQWSISDQEGPKSTNIRLTGTAVIERNTALDAVSITHSNIWCLHVSQRCRCNFVFIDKVISFMRKY